MAGPPVTETQSHLQTGGVGAPYAGALELRVVASPDERQVGRARTLEGTLTLGREGGKDLDLALADPRMSRAHARVTSEGDGWVVQDLRSKNGTAVDGEVTARATLRAGSVVRVGDTVLLVAEVDASTPGPRAIATRGVRALFHELGAIASSGLSVLITGETGSGKEVAARFVHEHSDRRGRFVAINCAAIPRDLAEATFFGHVRGAFTGAAADARGLLVASDRGTLFLDEVGELPLDLQPKLLRALDGGAWLPVGSDREQRGDLRVVSATNLDLEAAVEGGTFRRDLYARLAGHAVRLPPLRERRPDIPGIARGMLAALGRPEPGWTPAFVERLLVWHWPMNVRELESTLARAVVLARGATLDVVHLPRAPERGPTAPPSRPGGPSAPEGAPRRPGADELAALLGTHRGNVSAVASALGKERRQVYRWLEQHGIDPGGFR